MPHSHLISIVDDDEGVRSATASLVRSLGLRVQTFASAEDFLTSPWRDATACLVTDIHMGGMDGLALQAAVRRLGLGFPILFVTGLESERLRERALQGGAKAFFAKPLDVGAFLACLEDCLRSGGPGP